MSSFRIFSFVMVITTSFFLNGCNTYLRNRGNDTLDMVQIGFTFNDSIKPQFGLYMNHFASLPLGYSKVQSKFLGIVDRHIGWMDYENESWGALVWGDEKKGGGEFNPFDPHVARPDQINNLERSSYTVGLLRYMKNQAPEKPPVRQYISCNRILHLGWIGIIFNSSPVDIFDFFLGWLNIDIMKDDIVDKK